MVALANFHQGFITIHIFHHDVHEDKIRSFIMDQLHGLRTVGGFDDIVVAECLQKIAHGTAD